MPDAQTFTVKIGDKEYEVTGKATQEAAEQHVRETIIKNDAPVKPVVDEK